MARLGVGQVGGHSRGEGHAEEGAREAEERGDEARRAGVVGQRREEGRAGRDGQPGRTRTQNLW